MLGAAAGFGAVDGDGQAVVGGELHDLVGQLQLADDRVVQTFDAGLVVADVVGGPPRGELRTPGRQLAARLESSLS
jgi:hypothetical protein